MIATAQMFHSGVCFAGALVLSPPLFVFFAVFLFMCGFAAGYMTRQQREKEQDQEQKVKTLEEEVKNLKSELVGKSQNK
jgi:hypothetical protein